jgi:TIR domain-containing protein
MTKRKRGIVPRVFLSHSTRDQWVSERLKEKLEEVGVEVWLDAFDLPGGTNVKERIKEGMRTSTECLILLSPASRESDWVKHEAGIADGYGKPTVLVLLHVSDDDVPDPLRDLKFLSINEFPGYVRHLAAFARKK